MRVGSKRSGRSTSSSMPACVAHSSKVDEQPVHLEIGERARVGQRSGELGDAVAEPAESTDDPDPEITQRVEVDRASLRGADELGRGEMAGADDVVERVVPLVEDACCVGPPEDVAAAVGPGHPDVFADGQRDVATAAMDLLGELYPGGRRPDDQHATEVQVVGRCDTSAGSRTRRRRGARRRSAGRRRRCRRRWRRRRPRTATHRGRW